MPIVKTAYGDHEDVLFFEFGSGDIMMTRGKELGYSHGTQLIFSQSEPHGIGEETEGYIGRPSDEIPEVKAVMRFTKPESITAIIHSLIELQKELFKGETMEVISLQPSAQS